jgi:RNA recognition motif-containing protein
MATKVFVGNLSFQTNNDQLREHFTPFGEVVSVNIITRGPRSLGYGFVELASEEEAQKAVAAMDQKTLDGRVVNVQIARPQVKREEGEVKTSPKRTRPGNRRPRTESGAEAAGSPGGSSSGGSGGVRRRRTGPRRNRARSEKGEGSGSGSEEGSKPGQKRGGGAPRRTSQTGTAGARRNAPRKAVARKPRESSTTTLFVGNLPFSMEDQGLLELFSAHNPVKATIARKATQRSKGFGFVEFATEEAQKAALEAMTGKQVEGRDLNLKIALQPIEKEETQGEEGNSSSEGAAKDSEGAPASEKPAAEAKQEAAEGSAE